MEAEQIASQYWGIETRYPLADIRLMQYVLSVPIEQKININDSRLLFRKGMKGMLSENIRWRDNKDRGIIPFFHIEYHERQKHEIEEYLKSQVGNHKLNFLDLQKMITNTEYGDRIKYSPQNRTFSPATGRIFLLLTLIRYLEKMDFTEPIFKS
jgi:asparagine synthetase B (glutamine-hydrolysing)